MFDPRYKQFAAAFGFLAAMGLPAAVAQPARWAVSAASTDPCGEECYLPPTATVFTDNGQFAFGVQCGGEMVLAGPAMAQLATPITSVDMVIDGRSFGRFEVQTGLNDDYIRPTIAGGAQDWTAAVRPALAAGSVLQLWLGPTALLEFSLAGSRAALDGVDSLCAGGETAASGPQPDAPVSAPSAAGGWSGRTWAAYSSISLAITGNITTTPTEIIFANGARLPVRVVQDNLPGVWGVGEAGAAAVLQVTSPVNPTLLEGNTLCGPQPTFISLFVEQSGGLAMTVYSGPAAPRGDQSDAVCAMYFYGAI